MHPDILAAVDIGKIYITNNTQGIGDTVDAVGHARRFSLTELGGVLNGPVYENTNADLGTFPVEDRVEGPMASFQVTLNELQRVTALRFSNTSGGDGTAVWVELDAGAIMDLSLNTNALQYAVPMEEIPDTTPPPSVPPPPWTTALARCPSRSARPWRPAKARAWVGWTCLKFICPTTPGI